MTVVPFAPKEKTERHGTGKAKCLACKHEWVAVAPLPVTADLECPACGASRGVYQYPFDAAPDSAEWTCRCGNTLHKLIVRADHTEYALCVGCGNAKTIVM